MGKTLTPELLADMPLPSDPRISPDGRWLAASVAPASKKDEHPVAAIWLADTSGRQPARQLTTGLAEDTHPRWSPDGRQLAFLSDRAKRGKKQVHLLAVGGEEPAGEARSLTDEVGGACDLCWLPGDRPRIAYLAVDARDPDEEERRTKERDDAFVYGEFWPMARLVVLDVASGVARRYDLGNRHVAELSPSPDGTRLAMMLWETPEFDWWAAGGEIAMIDVATGALTVVAKPGFHAFSMAWSRGGDELFLLARAGETAVSSEQLWVVEARANAEPRLLTPDVPFCIMGIDRPRQRDELLLLAQTGTESAIHRYDPVDGDYEVLVYVSGDIAGFSVSDDGATLGAIVTTPDRPHELYAGPAEGELRRVSDLHGWLDDVELGPQEIMTWERTGFALDGILIWPPGKSRADGALPTIVSIHGGPYGRWPNAFLPRWGRWLAQQGYLVFLPNPRGGSGHGQRHAEAVLCTVGNEDYRDIMSGVDLLIEQGIADPNRLGCGGWSQGGFMTAWIVGQTERFKAGVMGAGVSDWGMMIATSDIPSYETLMGGGDPYAGVGPHSFDAQSPISFVHRATTPTLIVHGEKDERVPVSQGIFFHRGLRRYGVPTELVIYPREPHGFQERNHQLDLMRRMVDWYRRWIPVE